MGSSRVGKKDLLGKTIESVSETYPHTLSLTFSDGGSLSLVAMPFREGTLDTCYIEGDDFMDEEPK